jgi:hypothetical protein
MGFSESFVRDLLDNNELGHLRRQTRAGSSIRIRERDIEQWEEDNSVCPGLDKNDRHTDLGASKEATAGTSLGLRAGELEGNQQEPLMRLKPDENWSATLQGKLDHLRGKNASTDF